MKPKRTIHNQDRIFQTRLSETLNPNHRLLLLGKLIDWEDLEKNLSGFFKNEGAPGKPVKLVVGLLVLQHMSGLSDDQVVACWVENPYWQHFCGYDYLQWSFPIDPSSLSRWRKRIGKEGMKKILEATLRVALGIGAVAAKSLENVIVDTTVMPKNIAYPTDAKLYFRSIKTLVREAKTWNITLRQTYTFLSKKALRNACRYAHARQMKRAKRETRKLHTYLGRVNRDIQRQIEGRKKLQEQLEPLLKVTEKIYSQKRGDKEKIYSVHEPEVECISKGKAHKKYEFGCKASIVITHKEGFVLCSEALRGRPYDGHTLESSLKEVESVTQKSIKRVFVDKGYRGHQMKGKEVFLSGRRDLSYHFKKLLRRRQSIEPHIGHMKSEGKLDCNYLKGILGDTLNAILCGIGHNIRFLLRFLAAQPA